VTHTSNNRPLKRVALVAVAVSILVGGVACSAQSSPAAATSKTFAVPATTLRMTSNDDHKLAFYVTPGKLPAIVLDAGGGLDHSYWKKLVPALASQTGSEIITYDRSGEGKSSEVPGAFDPKSAADDLDSGLRQIGLHDDELASILDGVFPAPHTAPLVAQEAQQRVGSALSRTIRLGGTEKSDPVAKPTTAPAAMTAAENAALEQLHKIPFGTWFEFVTNQQGQSVRRKLAWYSTLTGRCLFVNQRGARTGDKTLDLLARDMARGQVRPILDKQGSLIDRAWNAIVDALRPQSAAATKKAP